MKKLLLIFAFVVGMTTGCSTTIGEQSSEVDRASELTNQSVEQDILNTGDQQTEIPTSFNEYTDKASELSGQLTEVMTQYLERDQLSEDEFTTKISEISDSYIQNLTPALMETELSQADIDIIYPILENFIIRRSDHLTSNSLLAKPLYQIDNKSISISESIQISKQLMESLNEIEPEKEQVFELQHKFSAYLPNGNYLSDITGAGDETIDFTRSK